MRCDADNPKRFILNNQGPSQNIRLAILDWRMGQEDGLDLALEMYQHSQWRRLPILMTSAWAKAVSIARFQVSGRNRSS